MRLGGPLATRRPLPDRGSRRLEPEAQSPSTVLHSRAEDFVSDQRERALGMGANITRRDFLNGIAITAGASLIPAEMWAAAAADLEPQDAADYYPPAKTGLRGSHPGSFEAMHKLRDGDFWDDAGKPLDTGESYDLVIVGGGISGLAAAHYFRKIAGEKARILILENHDDFGGHAKRNEFHAGNRMILGFGGTYSIESPAPYSAVAKGLVEELGIDVPSYPKYVSKDLYRSLGLRPRIFFDKETFGADKLVINPRFPGFDESGVNETPSVAALRTFLAEAPMSPKAKQDYERLVQEPKDYLPGLSSDQKKARMARISYAKYLAENVAINE